MVEPYQQGNLDRLCGLYAVINSIRQSLRQCHPMRTRDCRAIFAELIGQLEEEDSLCDALTIGLATPEISRLFQVAEQWLSEKKGLNIRHKKPFHRRPRVPNSEFLEMISSHLATSDTSVLALAIGRLDHWTVVRFVAANKLELFDSCGLHHFGLKSVNSDPPEFSGKTWQLVPTGLFLIEAFKT